MRLTDIDMDMFLSLWRGNFGPLHVDQQADLSKLVDMLGQDTKWTSNSEVAYVLATAHWETGAHFFPVVEWGDYEHFLRYEHPPLSIVLGNIELGDGYRYRGRGYVQLTGRSNYARIGKMIGRNMLEYPEEAVDEHVAYMILSRGMREGWFTGKKLSDFIDKPEGNGFLLARTVVNGMDRAQEIESIALKYATIFMTMKLRQPSGELSTSRA